MRKENIAAVVRMMLPHRAEHDIMTASLYGRFMFYKMHGRSRSYGCFLLDTVCI